jgi:hypothetical protein
VTDQPETPAQPNRQGASELENQFAAQLGGRAWSFLTLERTARLGAAEAAYPDELGVRYVYDSNVAHYADVQTGDLAVIRDDKVVLGTGRIDSIQTGSTYKIRQRCPNCRSTSYKFRTSSALPFRWAQLYAVPSRRRPMAQAATNPEDHRAVRAPLGRSTAVFRGNTATGTFRGQRHSSRARRRFPRLSSEL